MTSNKPSSHRPAKPSWQRDTAESCVSALSSLVLHLVGLLLLGVLVISKPAMTELSLVADMIVDDPITEWSDLETLELEPVVEVEADTFLAPSLVASDIASDAPTLTPPAVELDTLEVSAPAMAMADQLSELNLATQLLPSLGPRSATLAAPHDVEGAVKYLQGSLGPALASLRQTARSRTVVVRGAHDEMQSVLGLYGIPHAVIEGSQLASHLTPDRVVCLNCGADVPSSGLPQFVDQGGWLVSSDWAAKVLAQYFPQHLRVQAAANTDCTVAVSASLPNDPLLAGVMDRRVQARWWLESSSYLVHTRRGVSVLLTSEQLRAQYRAPVVACKFSLGRGQVLHLVGHFHQKDGNQAGLIAMHRMLLNFLLLRFDIQVPWDDIR